MMNYLELNKEKNIEMTNLAYSHCNKEYQHSELINELLSEDDLKKQLCILNIETLYSQEEADKLLFNLTNQTGSIREATAYKINELMQQKDLQQFFQTKSVLDVFLQSITDINPTVCRNIIDCLDKISNTLYFETHLFEKIFEVTESLKEFKQCKSYILNKKTFKLYWCLEAITKIFDRITQIDNLNLIIKIVSEYNDYTIREKATKILSGYERIPSGLEQTFLALKQDENIYVKRHLN